MPEIKRVFSSGRMNKDLDERLVPNGEYRDALNIRVTSDSYGNSGAVQNINGNEKIGNVGISGAEVVGSIVDTSTDYVYWFVHGTSIDAIVRHDSASDPKVIEPVLVDVHNGTPNVLKFIGNYITGINIIESALLAWTDNNSEPKIIDIAECVAGSADFSSHTQLYSRNFIEEDITVIKKKPNNAPSIALTNNAYDGEDNTFYNLEFVRFSYRWRFNNNQYSIMAPFSETAFMPGTFNYKPENAYNTGMENTVELITLNNIEVSSADIAAVEILVKKSNDQTIYIAEKINVTAPTTLNGIEITSDKVYSVLSSDQILRQWDAVPLKSKAQEFISNRLVYGNYTLGENTSDLELSFNVDTINRTSAIHKRSIKSNRTYQFGVVFEDEYGRQTPVLSGADNTIVTPYNDVNYLSNLQAFEVSITSAQQAAIESRFSRYKYYIKEVSNSYYNISIDSVFPDPTERDATNTNAVGETWISLPSAEINKFEEGDFLILKKAPNAFVPYTNNASVEHKFKVLNIQSEAPSFIGSAPTGYTTGDSLPANTNFDYENYNTSGKFFINLSDPYSLLVPFWQTNDEVPEGTTFYPSDFIYPWGGSTSTGQIGTISYCNGSGTISLTNYYYEDGEVGYTTTSYSDPSCTVAGYTVINGGNAVVSDITLGSKEILAADSWFKYPNIDSNGMDVYVRRISSSTVDEVFAWDTSLADTEKNPGIFETDVDNGILDIYYETEDSYPTSDLANSKELRWFNCFNFQNGVESDRIQDDFNAPVMEKQVRVSTVVDGNSDQIESKNTLIWSGLYNYKNGFNSLNQFSTGESITKDLNPEYGSIQKLHARDTDLISFCEDKVLRILANKDALYNADGATNITASNNVLGQAVPYAGEFGISKNPESFATYGYRAYFADKSRTAVLRLSMDGLEVISMRGMQRYFDEKLNGNTFILGSYDEEYDEYNVTFATETVSFREANDGWVSRKSFIPESAVSLNGRYYTFKTGEIWQHNDLNYNKNTFYGATRDLSTISFIYNDEPSTIKNFYTLGYEGDPGWELYYLTSDLTNNGAISGFVEKEGKYFSYIRNDDSAIIDIKQSTVKGLGTRS